LKRFRILRPIPIPTPTPMNPVINISHPGMSFHVGSTNS
jgi:hypothetical protein